MLIIMDDTTISAEVSVVNNSSYHHDFKHVALLKGKEKPYSQSFHIGIPLNNDNFNDNSIIVRDYDKTDYQSLFRFTIIPHEGNMSTVDTSALSLLENDVYKFSILVDVLLNHYDNYYDNFSIADELISGFGMVKLELSDTIINTYENNGLIVCDNDDMRIQESTYYHHFINSAYDYYITYYDSITSNHHDSFFYRLLISLTTLVCANGMFSANYMVNPFAYNKVDSKTIVDNSIARIFSNDVDYSSEIPEEYDYLNNLPNELSLFSYFYYSSVISPELLEELSINQDDALILLQEYDYSYFKNFDDIDDFHWDSKEEYLEENYGGEPENINNIVKNMIAINNALSLSKDDDSLADFDYYEIEDYSFASKDINDVLDQL